MILFQGRICVFKYRQYMYIVLSTFLTNFRRFLPPKFESSRRIRIQEVSHNTDPCGSGSRRSPKLQIRIQEVSHTGDPDPGCLPYCRSVGIRIQMHIIGLNTEICKHVHLVCFIYCTGIWCTLYCRLDEEISKLYEAGTVYRDTVTDSSKNRPCWR